MKKIIQLHINDNVAIALTQLKKGESIDFEGKEITTLSDIKLGHKIALKSIDEGEKIIRNNVLIGSTTKKIEAGEHVHLHNLKSDYIPTLNKHYQNREVKS